MRAGQGRFAGITAAGLAALLVACSNGHTSVPAAPSQVEAASAAQPASAPVETAGAEAFTEEGIAALEAQMAAYVDEGAVMGIDTLLVKDGQEVSRMMAGVRRQADGAPIEEDTLYRIYSMTKPVTGVALLMLWEEGKFDLDDPVTKYIPELQGLEVFQGLDEGGVPILTPVSRTPTIRDLMSHTAGFGYGLRSGDYVNDRFREANIFALPDLQTMIDTVADIPLLYEPGTTWSYSISVDIQGYLVETLSGQRFGEFLEERIFAPLGMEDTAFFVPEDAYDRFSDVFVWAGDEIGWFASDAPGFQYRENTIAFEGGGHGLVATMADYARFAEMLANGGSLDGAQILKPETVALMAENMLPEGVYIGHDGVAGTAPAGGGFGLNVGVVTDSEAAGLGYPNGAFMWGGAAGTWFWVDPVNNLYFIGMVQHFGGGGPAFGGRVESARLVYDALRGEE